MVNMSLYFNFAECASAYSIIKHWFIGVTLNGRGYDGHNQTNEAIKLALQH